MGHGSRTREWTITSKPWNVRTAYTLPVVLVLAVPLALAVRGLDNNVYTQIGIELIIVLASKKAILIVEFAREQRAQGKSGGDRLPDVLQWPALPFHARLTAARWSLKQSCWDKRSEKA